MDGVSPEKSSFVRYIDPEFFVAESISCGWSPAIRQSLELGSDAADCEVLLTRPVGDGFGMDEFDYLADTAGILDPETGHFKDGFRLALETPRKSRMMRRLGIVTDPILADVPFLTLYYEGKVSDDILGALETLLIDQKVNLPSKLGARISDALRRLRETFKTS